MSDLPTISVVIPNYNYAGSLDLCIRSVVEQDYPPTEVIVVDDCSTDDSVDRASRPGVTVLSTSQNSGVAVARNLGAAHATGEILFFLDSDVALSAGALRRAVELLAANPSVGAVCGIYEAEPLIRDSLLEECRCLQACYWRESSLGSVSWLFSAMCAMPSRVFKEIGPFNARLRHTEEVDYGQRLSPHYQIMLTSEVRGYHDDDSQLIPLIRKIFTRGRMRVPLYAQRRKFANGFETPSRAWASVLAFLALAALAAPAFLGAVGWVAPALLFAATLACDLGMYRFTAARRGLRFMPAFIALQFIFNLTVFSSIAFGAAQWLLSRRFRTLYDDDSPGQALAPAQLPAQRRPEVMVMPSADQSGQALPPRVSVVIPNYNYANILGLCLESVFSQTHPPHEVIVSDDASTDNSLDVAAAFPCRVVTSERNRGVSAARNAGIAASSGDVLFFVDSDEALAPDAIEEALRLLAEDPKLGCVHGVIAPEPLIDDGPVEWYRTLHAHHWRKRAVGRTPTAYFAVAAVPRHVIDAVGLFDERLRDSEDVEYSERLFQRFGILLTDQVVAYHDEEHLLGRMLGEQFRRAQLLILFAAAHRSRPGALRANSGLGVAAALLALASVPLCFWMPVLSVVPALSIATFALADIGLARFVLRRRGPVFLWYFLAVHLLVNVSIGVGAAVGLLRSLADRDFGRTGTRPAPRTQ
jgi:glycosyltransferase involved in cell wall biosynthesis